MKYLVFLLLVGCGVNHKHNVSKIKVEAEQKEPFVVEIDNKLMEAATFCDSRYGYRTVESEDCFLDFRNYFNTTPDLDKQIILTYCTTNYSELLEVEACMTDLNGYYEELYENTQI